MHSAPSYFCMSIRNMTAGHNLLGNLVLQSMPITFHLEWHYNFQEWYVLSILLYFQDAV
jgi:hypothetical protein